MNHQLHLLPKDAKTYRRLDAETKAVGRRGLAQARAALRAARTAPDRPPRPAHRPSSHSHVVAEQRRSAA